MLFISNVFWILARDSSCTVAPSGPRCSGHVFDTSDLPDGTVNIVTGRSPELMKVLAEHADVDAIWCFADGASSATAKSLTIGNLKQVFTNEDRVVEWFNVEQGEGRWFLHYATQVKNIWVPYGE
jgi:aldehyde dehydrogenase (NAD+)